MELQEFLNIRSWHINPSFRCLGMNTKQVRNQIDLKPRGYTRPFGYMMKGKIGAG